MDRKAYQILTDHPSVDGQVLGNVRITFTEGDNGQAEIIQEDHYYPFGLRMSGQHYSNTDLLNKYLYNAKELQDQTGYYDYGFRQMDPALGRWFVTDALAEKYASVSPYAYVSNNPISFYDILGLEQQTMSLTDILTELWNNTGDNGVGTWSSGGGFTYYSALGEAQDAGVEFPSINWGAGSGGSGVSSSDVHANSFGGKLLSSGFVRNVLDFLGYNVSPYAGGYHLSWDSSKPADGFPSQQMTVDVFQQYNVNLTYHYRKLGIDKFNRSAGTNITVNYQYNNVIKLFTTDGRRKHKKYSGYVNLTFDSGQTIRANIVYDHSYISPKYNTIKNSFNHKSLNNGPNPSIPGILLRGVNQRVIGSIFFDSVEDYNLYLSYLELQIRIGYNAAALKRNIGDSLYPIPGKLPVLKTVSNY